jgi:ribonuclease T2
MQNTLRSRFNAGTLGLVLCLFAVAAVAHHHRHHGAAVPTAAAGQFDYYLLTLSWSPSYCVVHPEDRAQCSGKGYGFVLHGLWPQYLAGGYPDSCTTDARISAAARQVGETLFPSPKLIEHEWQHHGTCSGMDALEYFRTGDRAVAVVQVPAALQAPRTTLSMSAAQIHAAFRAANPRMPADGMMVACRGAELAEVRVCLSRTLELRSCGRGVRDSCPAVGLRIPAAR